MVRVNRAKVLCQHKQPKWLIYWFLETIFVIQGLLFVVYVVAMIILILSVIGEPISGVVILILGIPVTVAYLILALIAQWLEPRVMGWSSECPECKALNVGSKNQMAGKINCGGCGVVFSPKELNEHPPR